MLRRLTSATKTALCLSAACALVPAVILTCLSVQLFRKITHCLLARKYPHLEFSQCNTVRSVLDTTRNAGVVVALVKVHSSDFSADAIKAKLLETVVLKESKLHELYFPKLSQTLVSCWGRYAWIRESTFDINNHVIVAASTFRGRQFTEAIVQEYAGDVASKYMPPNIPPWQVHIIPVPATTTSTPVASSSNASSTGFNDSNEDINYYMLLRIHHQLLTEEPALKLGDLLLISHNNSKSIQDIQPIAVNPLETILQPPVHTFDLCSRIKVALSNRWNEFIYEYDPLEAPDCDKYYHAKCLSQLLSILLISGVKIASDFIKGFHAVQNGPVTKFKFLASLTKREIAKRNLSWSNAMDAVKYTISPLNALPNIAKSVIRSCLQMALMWPPLIYNELMAIRCCFFLGHGGYPSTIVGFLYEYLPLIMSATGEVIRMLEIGIKTPRTILETMLLSDEDRPAEKQHQQEGNNSMVMPSFGGRKTIAWSCPVRMSAIKKFANKLNVSETEVILAAIGAPLKDSLESVDTVVLPQRLDINFKCMRIDNLLGKDVGSLGQDGVVCMKLPLRNASNKQLMGIREELRHATDNQMAIFILTVLNKRLNFLTQVFPEFLIQILINHLSKKFTISVTEILETTSPCWTNSLGDIVEEFMYFEPLQSKMCTSVTIQRFRGNVRIGVSTDVQMTPSHVKLANLWHYHMNNWIQQ